MLIEIILITLVVVIIGSYFIRVSHIGKKIKLILIACFFIFLIVTISSIINQNDIQLNSLNGYIQLSSLYLQWLDDFGKQSVQFTGNAVKSIADMFK